MPFVYLLETWFLIAFALTAVAAWFDIKDRNLPIWLLVGGAVLAFARAALMSRTELPLGLAWMVGCILVAWVISRVELPAIGEHDIAWYGIIGGLLGTLAPILLFLCLSIPFALVCLVWPGWRKGMPYVVPMLFAVGFICVLLLL